MKKFDLILLYILQSNFSVVVIDDFSYFKNLPEEAKINMAGEKNPCVSLNLQFFLLQRQNNSLRSHTTRIVSLTLGPTCDVC